MANMGRLAVDKLTEGLDEIIRKVVREVVDGELEAALETRLEREVVRAVEGHNFENDIEGAVSGYNFLSAIEEALEEYDFEVVQLQVRGALETTLDSEWFQQKMKCAVSDALAALAHELLWYVLLTPKHVGAWAWGAFKTLVGAP